MVIKMCDISVIVPAYNEEKRIKKCIDSILNQTFKNFELIIVNDGSTDNTDLIVRQYLNTDKRIKYIDSKNEGQGAARNKGILQAKSKYITFVDSDDTIENNMLELLYNEMIMKKADVVICDLYKIIENTNKKVVFKNYIKYSNVNKINFMLSHPGPVARLYKKELFIKNKIYFPEKVVYEDLGTIPFIAMKSDRIEYLENPLYNYIIRDNSTMNQKKFSSKIDDIFKIMNIYNDIYDKCEYKEEIEYLNIEHLLYSAMLRYVDFPSTNNQRKKILNIIKTKYPNWRKNKYYKQKSIRFKIVCELSYKKFYFLLKVIKFLKG